MNAKDIVYYLTLLGIELEMRGLQEPIELLLIGGGFMLTQVKNRVVTGDIDAVWVLPDFFADSEVYRLFEAAVREIGEHENLGLDWLNVAGTDFVHETGIPDMKLWKKFRSVHIYLPPKDFILAHKLLAGREKDMADINALCAKLRVKTREKAQKVIDKYFSRDVQRISHAAEKLDRYVEERLLGE